MNAVYSVLRVKRFKHKFGTAFEHEPGFKTENLYNKISNGFISIRSQRIGLSQ